jgi:hypothetical protein
MGRGAMATPNQNINYQGINIDRLGNDPMGATLLFRFDHLDHSLPTEPSGGDDSRPKKKREKMPKEEKRGRYRNVRFL